MNERKSFSINPGTAMIDVLGHSGYTFDFAIADLIDNCIAAHAKNISIFFNLKREKPFIYILDDGDGMSIEKLREAAVVGFKDISSVRADDDLGRYSTGLKSATRSFCNNIIIASKIEGENANVIQLDFDHIIKSKKWEAFELEDFEFVNKLNSKGTMVFCDDLTILGSELNLSNVYSKIDALEKSLSHIFGKYLLRDDIKISIQAEGSNPIYVKGWNPFGLIENQTTKTVYDDKRTFKGSTIYVKAYILPVFNNLSPLDQEYMAGNGLLEQEGFYIYRNDRLIQEGGWLNLENIKLSPKSQYARIEVKITADLDEEFKINFSKNSLIVPDELVPWFKEIATKARNESKNSANYLKHPEFKKKLKTEEEKVWKVSHSSVGTVLTVNIDHPLIVEICDGLSIAERKKLFSTLAKSLPIGMIQMQNLGVDSYTENEMMELIDAMYKKLKGEGLTLKEIKAKIVTIEPFKDNKEFLIKYFDELEED
jgi:hypothetical protein